MASSERRINANRANALKSTGPKTDEGTEASRANASKHGMTAVVVISGEDAGEADRRIDRLQRQLAPDGDELGLILARHAAILSMQVDRCAANITARAAQRVRTAQAERLFTSIAAEGPANHRRLLAIPEGIDLLIDQIEDCQNHLRSGAAWTGDHAHAFDHLIERDAAEALSSSEVPQGDRLARRTWTYAEVAKLVDAELDRLRGRHAAFDPVKLAEGRATAADRATVGDDPASQKVRKSRLAADRAMLLTLEQIRRTRRDEDQRADPVAKAELGTDLAWKEPNPNDLPPVMASFLLAALKDVAPIDASSFTIGKPPIRPETDPKAPRNTP